MQINEAHLCAKMEFESKMLGANYLAYPPVVAGGQPKVFRLHLLYLLNVVRRMHSAQPPRQSPLPVSFFTCPAFLWHMSCFEFINAVWCNTINISLSKTLNTAPRLCVWLLQCFVFDLSNDLSIYYLKYLEITLKVIRTYFILLDSSSVSSMIIIYDGDEFEMR